MMGRIGAGTAVLLCCAGLFAQSNEWPLFLISPEPVEPDGDSAVVRLSTDATVFQNSEKTSSGLDWRPVSASWKMRQQCHLETSHEVTAHAMNQFYDFSGSVTKNGALPHNGDIGLEWTPVSYLYLRQSSSSFNTTADIGPHAQWRVYDVPVRVRGGVSGTGWNDSLPAPILKSNVDSLHGDIGYYGACALGDPKAKLLGNPLYFNAEAFGRSINQAGLVSMTGSAFYAGRIGDGDSLYAFYGDSLSNGKEIPWGFGGGSQRYANTPWRIARSFRAAGALKARERFGLLPGVIYSYSRNSVEYPTLRMLSNVKVNAHSLNVQLRTKESLPVTYKGGIIFTWGAEEWLFGNDLTFAAMSYYKTAPQLDSLSTKLQDHQNYTAVSDHRVEVVLPHASSLIYKVSLFRDSKTYFFSFFHNNQEFRSYEDNDRISLIHHVGFVSRKLPWLNGELFGEYSEYLLGYLRKERSAQNLKENGYRFGLEFSFKPSDRFTIDERIVADAEISDYFYKKAHQNPFDPPSHQRRLTSLCTGRWKLNDTWAVNGRWYESYYDKGLWYGKEYRPPEADSLPSDYYAIQNKQTDYSVVLGLGMIKDWIRMESGCSFQDIFSLAFNGQTYVVDTLGLGKGYMVEPFTEIRLRYRWVTVKGRAARMINTAAEDRWALRKNWDIRLVGQAEW